MISQLRIRLSRIPNDELLKIQEVVTLEIERRKASQFNNEVALS